MRRLTALLNIGPEDGRGDPLNGVQAMCLALGHFGGGHFIRISALCGQASYGTSWNMVDRVREALCELAPRYIRMPTDEEMAATARLGFL